MTVTRLQIGCYGVRVPTGARDLSILRNVQTGSGPQAVSYSMGVKWPACELIKNEWSHTSAPIMPSWREEG